MSVTNEQDPGSPAAAAKSANEAAELDGSLRKLFNAGAILVGGILGLLAILIDWYVGRLWS